MKSQPKPISIPDSIAARCIGPDQAQRMDRKVVVMPRSEALGQEAKWNKAQAKKKAPHRLNG
jgi:hypothetical protein